MSVPDFLGEVRDEGDVHTLWRMCVAESVPGGLYMEFGVSSGTSLTALRGMIPHEYTLYGFDSFAGLPEQWGEHAAGTYASSHRVNLPNTVLVEGLFSDTLPKFAAEHKGFASFIHIDCDLYSSTKTVFAEFKDNIRPGTVIVFDEFFGYPGWEDHEYKAFNEFIAESGHQYQFIVRDGQYRVGVKIL